MSNSILLSVIIPTFNPNIERLNQTLNALAQQTLDKNSWELLLIDNNSNDSFHSSIDLMWHPRSKIMIEPKQGLTFARMKGFIECSANIIVMVDDDNLLDSTYLEKCLLIMHNDASLGAIGGKSQPEFVSPPPVWLKEFYSSLALRDLGNEIIVNKWDICYPKAAPIGAGMVIRKTAIFGYRDKIQSLPTVISDRTGNSLGSSGDNDIVLEILKSGFSVGYFPELVLKHIIPPFRMEEKYLAKLVNNTNKSWAMLLRQHKICPWNEISRWSLPLRKLKAFFTHAAWKNEANFIKWKGACGLYDGLSR